MKLLAYAAALALAALTVACSPASQQADSGYSASGIYVYNHHNPAINSPIQARTYTASPS